MSTRRQFLASAAATAYGQTAKPRLNVVVILCDDLGYGDLGSYGSPIATPNIDSLGRDGMRFTQYYSGNPVCSPSRAALLTGRYCVRAGVPMVLFPRDKVGMPTSEITMANVLKGAGYATQIVGKWHLGHVAPYLPTFRGFDHYFGIPYSNDMSPRWLMDDTKVVEENTGLEELTPRYTDRAVKFIEASKGKPFFLYMPHTYPHIPLAASKRFAGKSPQGIYGDVVQEIDWSVGEILAALKRIGAEQNTLVIFTSDNGPWYQGSPGRLRGRKGMTWEGGQRVPMLARLPGRIPKGRVSDNPCGTWDLMPTICNLTGVTKPNVKLDGVDLTPVLTGKVKTIEREPMLIFDGWDLQCARWGKWKLHVARRNHVIYSPAPAEGVLTLPVNPELYDVTTDLDESYNVADQNPQVVAQIMGFVDRMMEGMPDAVRNARAEVLKRRTVLPPSGALPRPASN
ncbi:MAG: sulfatase [Acidobacteriota bacterium]